MNSTEGVGPPDGHVLCVGEFTINLVQRRLFDANGAEVEISPRLFDALALFATSRGELLDKDRLLQELWPGQIVEENNLNKTVSALRRTLGDDPEHPRYLMTVPRRGFRFVADVHRGGPGALPAKALLHAEASREESVKRPRSKTQPPLPITGSQRSGLGRRGMVAGLSTAALAAGAGGIYVWHRVTRTDSPAPTATLAVLPFSPLATGANDPALELGMADSLITQLSAIPDVIVRPIGAVRRYATANADSDPVRAARELGVQWIIDGTVQQSGDRTRVTARLLDASKGTAAWTASFDERFVHVFDVQESISRRVAEVLRPRLAARQARAQPSGTRNAEAYRIYLQARYHSMLFTPEDFRLSMSLYNQAITTDPKYAYAYVGLADALRRSIYTSNATPKTTFEAIRDAAARAVEIDPMLGEALALLGWVSYQHDWDWAVAEQTFLRARELNRSSVDASSGLAHVLMSAGRHLEAARAFGRSTEIDPSSPLTNTLEGGILTILGKVGEGVARMRRAITINRDFWIAHLFLGNVMSQVGDHDQAPPPLGRAHELSKGSAWAAGSWSYALAKAGSRREARSVLDTMKEKAKVEYISPSALATAHLGLDEFEEALAALEEARRLRDARMVFLSVDPRLSPLHGTARFSAIARDIKLDPGLARAPSPF